MPSHNDYQIGDQVKVCFKPDQSELDRRLRWVPEMNVAVGHVGTVTDLSKADPDSVKLLHDVTGQPWWYPKSCLRKVHAEANCPFTVGDRITLMRQPDKYDPDWVKVWNRGMDLLVGQTITYVGLSASGGNCYISIDGYSVPWCLFEVAEAFVVTEWELVTESLICVGDEINFGLPGKSYWQKAIGLVGSKPSLPVRRPKQASSDAAV